ncbi:hypothetical protein RJ639_037743 [Escallonia herrerae]|uniref:Fungal lipase-type domain-containing protein n=1 Tax=Escallonia herrerae TaxID=1293975 RepID=A0AA89B7L2_9ASTE|nr:hypothetical protein RJ639_037743 [Escallonia herrerae]
MAYDGQFCSQYLALKPEEASLFDLVRVLWSGQIERVSFLECTEPKKLRDLGPRWLIFISVVAQRLLLSMKRPLAFMGFMMETWLNLLSSNDGIFRLLLHALQGKVVKPDKNSATYTSVVGNLDRRVELDRSIKKGDSRYDASLSMMAAKLSYENEAFVQAIIRDHWKVIVDLQPKSDETFSTQAIMFQDTSSDSDLIVVAFRGTDPFVADDWCTDVDLSWYDVEGWGKVHAGFMKALGLQKTKGWPKEIQQGPAQRPYAYYTLREELRQILQKNERAKFILTGHSLGGALAILFGAVLALHEEAQMLERLEGVYTFGQPRVGDERFGESMKEKLEEYDVRYSRYVYCNDIVPRLPYDDKTLLYKHFGPCLYYGSCYEGKKLEEEPNKNYFSLLWLIPKNLNAVWELTRGFIIPFVKGAEYKEGWFLRLYRFIGIAIPGLPAHSPGEYVNITRLGTDPSSLHLEKPTCRGGLKRD